MSTGVTVLLDQYLDNMYRPDCEYIDRELLVRNVGELEHSRFQTLLSRYLSNREKQLGIVVLVEQHVQVKSTRFRVPDITVVAGPMPSTSILEEPQFLCIEILSREDSLEDIQDRVDAYLGMGVPHVWVVNPRKSRAFHYTADGMREAKDGVLRTVNPDITVPISELENL